MGAYSSWAVFALAHHFLLYLACKRANVSWKRCPYCLLGDDIVICDDIVAFHYMDILSEWDVPFNPDKTHSSFNFYEFAKQYYLDDINVSPFPIAALYELRNDTFSSVATIVRELTYKDWSSDIWASIKDYFCLVKGWNNKKVKLFLPKIKLGIAIMFHLQGVSDLGIALKEYVAESTGKKVSWTNYSQRAIAQYIAGNVVTDLFLESRDRITGNNPEPLGELSTQMVMSITSLRDGGADCFDLIESVPFLQIYGRAEQVYLKLLRPTIGARLIKDGSQMRSALEIVDIPLTDKDFYQRHRDVIVIKSLKASKRIVEMLTKFMERNNNFHKSPILPL
jgi:hypothetical protein